VVETHSASGALHQAARPPGRSVPPSRSAVIETEALPATRITRNPDRARRAGWTRSRNPPSCHTLRRIAVLSPIRLTKLISPLAEVARRINIARSIARDDTRLSVAMKRRMRPVAHALDQAVLERIDVAYSTCRASSASSRMRYSQNRRCQMPRSPRAPCEGHCVNPVWQRSGKTALDQPPARRDIAIARWQVQTACR